MTTSFYDGPVTDLKNLDVYLKARAPNVFLIIRRSKNANVVIYEANVKNGVLDKTKPIDVYWLDIDSAYRAHNRGHDRVEMNAVEMTHAFGVEWKFINDREVSFTFNADPSRPSRLVLHPQGPRMMTVYNGDVYLVRSAYVIGANFVVPDLINLRANIKELSFNGVNLTTKQPTTVVVLRN